jgi:hypothetical protein
MAKVRITNLKGLNTFVNPLEQPDGQFTRLVNVDSYPLGAKKKRPGYTTYLGATDGSLVKDLFTWYKEDDSTFFVYKTSGTQIMVSAQGTGAWTACTNGEIAGTAHVGHASLNNVLIIGDGVGSTRHTTDGSTFTNTTLAPVASDFVEFQKRIYAMGTASTEFFSTTNDATNWNLSGTSDSSSFVIPGEGSLLKTFKVSDRVFLTKTSGNIMRWDGDILVDTATKLGPSSPYSYAETEDFAFWINRLGHFATNGDKPELMSNPVQRQFYNDAQTGIAGTTFPTIPAEIHRYDYFASIGTVTDDFTEEQIPDAILKYDYQKGEYSNYKFANFPTAYHSFVNNEGNQQLIFGDSTGQVYTYGGTTTDNGTTIEAVIEGMIHMGVPELDKEWRWIWMFFNPGNQAKVQVAIGDTFHKASKKWLEIGDCSRGVTKFRFPKGSRGRFCFFKVYEASRTDRFDLYGFAVDATVIDEQ